MSESDGSSIEAVDVDDHFSYSQSNDQQHHRLPSSSPSLLGKNNEMGGVYASGIKLRREKEARECLVDRLPRWTIGSNIEQQQNNNINPDDGDLPLNNAIATNQNDTRRKTNKKGMEKISKDDVKIVPMKLNNGNYSQVIKFEVIDSSNHGNKSRNDTNQPSQQQLMTNDEQYNKNAIEQEKFNNVIHDVFMSIVRFRSFSSRLDRPTNNNNNADGNGSGKGKRRCADKRMTESRQLWQIIQENKEQLMKRSRDVEQKAREDAKRRKIEDAERQQFSKLFCTTETIPRMEIDIPVKDYPYFGASNAKNMASNTDVSSLMCTEKLQDDNIHTEYKNVTNGGLGTQDVEHSINHKNEAAEDSDVITPDLESTIFVTQKNAIIEELTKLVRRKALELTRHRLNKGNHTVQDSVT